MRRHAEAIAAAVGFAAMLWALATCAPGCATVSPSRQTARAAVLATTEAVKAADHACARVALERRDVGLAQRCADGYVGARLALLATAEGVDAWDRHEARASVSCAVKQAASALDRLSADVASAGGDVPRIVEDALALAALLAPCEVP